MALSVNWNTGLITCPQSDLTLVSGTKYQITVDYLWQLLRDRSDDEDALAYPILYTNIPSTASTPRIVEINDDYYTFQFENGNYSVNIINGNTNIRDVEVKNNVSIGTNNTTGFINPTFLELGLFAGAVSVDTLYGYTQTPTGYTSSGLIIGTRQAPVNTIADAILIAEQRGIRELHLVRSMTIGTGVNANGFLFHADSPLTCTLTIETDADVTNCEFKDLTIQGVLDGGNVLRQCLVLDIEYFNGYLQECGLNGTITLAGAAQAALWNCFSNVAGGNVGQTPCIDMGGADNSLIIRDYHGGIELENYTGGTSSVSLDMSSGRVVLGNTLTGGTIYIRGICRVEGTTGGTIINTDGVLNKADIVNAMWNQPVSSNNTAGTFGAFMQKLLTTAKFLGLK